MMDFPVLSLGQFGVSFGQRVVLDNISLSLPAAGVDVLMGPVKTGKSTLFRTLSGMYEGHALHKFWGQVWVQGEPIQAGNRPALVLQHAGVFNLTLLQALLEPIRKTRQHSPVTWRNLGVEWLIEHGLEECLPLVDQPLLQCPVRLQRCVMILAQALLRPPLLMIDEPTFSLNETDATWFVNWLRRLSEHCRLWVGLHNQAQAKRLADRVVLLGGGQLLAHQSTTEFFTHPANDVVAQFVRTGSFSLPELSAKPQDLEQEVAPPPPLSQKARQVVQSASVSPSAQGVAKAVVPPAPALVTPVVAKPAVPPVSKPVAPAAPTLAPYLQSSTAQASSVGETTRKLAALPSTSRYGVEQAAAVGNVFFHDSSAPRGFHWIVPGKLAGCPAPGVTAPIDYDMALLAKTGITKLVTLTEVDLDQAVLQKHGLTNIHLPIFDRESPSINQTHMLLVRMQKFIDAGERLAVHCKAGLGRTGTILAAWLIREGGLSADDAIKRLRRINNGYIQSQDQEDFLYSYEADLVNRLL